MESTSTTAPKKSKFKKILWISFFTILLISVAYVFICGISYSEGTRSGVLYKISKKGFVFKTYEGELNLGGFSEGDGTVMSQKIWNFSVKDNEMFDKLNTFQGKRIVVDYKEVIRVFFWQGETRYFVTNVKELN
ncbi:MAG: 6-phosphogluconate dehydrogenase [Bacteroidota bacterium]